MRKGKGCKFYESKGYKSAMVDMHSSLPRPNRLQPIDDVSEMNKRSRALAKQLGITNNG